MAVPVQTEACASLSRALVVTPMGRESATATVALPVPTAGRYTITLYAVRGLNPPWAPPRPARAAGTVRIGPATWQWIDAGSGCVDLGAFDVDLAPPSTDVTIEAREGPVAIDKITIRKR
jgi:hypothetical protein